MVLLLAICLFIFSMTFTGVSLARMSRAAYRRRRPVSDPPPKILTPLDNPWGPMPELIEWAEKRAEHEHRAAYSDPVTDALVDRFRRACRTEGVTVMEDRPAPDDAELTNGKYGRYLKDIGYVTADSRELLDRACEVALGKRFDEYQMALVALDSRITAAARLPGPNLRMASLREQRFTTWQAAKSVVELMQAIGDQKTPVSDAIIGWRH